MVEATREAFRRVDVLVNNAAKATDEDFLSLGGETWDEDVTVTLKGPFLCSQTVLVDMVENGSGVILNISSVNALGYYGNEACSAAKAGILNLTRSLAVRYGPSGIRVNAIAPGILRTPAWEQRGKRTLMSSSASPGDIRWAASVSPRTLPAPATSRRNAGRLDRGPRIDSLLPI
jgi:NAD(P)-dependent dehydrogenase (short-subunit alcohol dehydrogenase family)